ncbi:MAG: IS200/IS605 family transposase [Waterburya sp.]
MSSSFNKGFRSVYKPTAHIVLVTKYRKKAINQERLLRLKEIFEQTLVKWECTLVNFNSESDHCHLIIDIAS